MKGYTYFIFINLLEADINFYKNLLCKKHIFIVRLKKIKALFKIECKDLLQNLDLVILCLKMSEISVMIMYSKYISAWIKMKKYNQQNSLQL